MAEPVHYWKLIEPVWLPLNRSWDKGPDMFVRRFRRIRAEVGHLYAAHWCHSEVCNGGFQQFFSNTTGLLAPEASEGFRAIGTVELSEVVAEAMKRFGTPYPRNRDDRTVVLHRQCPRGERDLFSELDKRFYKWSDRWDDVANAYAGGIVASGRG